VPTLLLAFNYPLLLFGLLTVFAILAIWLLPKLLRAQSTRFWYASAG
jgi:hypothetical protein